MKLKLWHIILVLVLLGAGGLIIAQEVRYRDQVRDALEQADSMDVLVERFDATQQALEVADAALEVERRTREVSQAAADSTIRDLDEALEGQRRETDRLEDRVRDLVGDSGQPAVDSLRASHGAEVADLERQKEVLAGELVEETRLRVQVDSVLFATRAALDECQCALEQAQTAVDAFRDVTDGRGWASRAWDSVTSPRGLVTIGVVGLAVYGLVQLVDGGQDVVVRYPDDGTYYKAPAVDFAVTWP